MRVSLIRTILGLTFCAAGLVFASSSMGQTLLPPGGPGDTTAKKPPQMQEIDDAVILFKQGDFDGAQKSLEGAAKKNADLPPAEVLMAQLFAQANSGQGMMVYLDKAVQKNPDDPEAYVLLGEVDLNQRRVTQADLLLAKAAALIAKFNKSAERKAKLMPRIYNGLASVAELREDWPLAQQRLNEFLKLDPKNAQVMQRVARSLFQQKKAQEALEKLREASKIPDADVLTPEAMLARFYLQFGDPANAKKWIGDALKNAPKDLRTRLVAAQIYVETNDFEEAKAQATEALKIDPKSLDAKMLRGVVALFQKDYAGAASTFEDAVIQSPSNFAATNNLALALVELKDESKKKRALEYASENYKKTQAKQNDQNTPEALSTLGWVLYRTDPVKNLEDADKVMRQAVQTNAFNPDTAYYAAVIAQASKRPEEAKALLKRGLKSTTPWTMKADAKAMLEQLSKE